MGNISERERGLLLLDGVHVVGQIVNPQKNNLVIVVTHRRKHGSPNGHIKRSVRFAFRIRAENMSDLRYYGVFTVPFGHGREVGRRCLQKFNCWPVSFSVDSMACGAIISIHLLARVRLTLRGRHFFQSFVGGLRDSGPLGQKEDCKE